MGERKFDKPITREEIGLLIVKEQRDTERSFSQELKELNKSIYDLNTQTQRKNF